MPIARRRRPDSPDAARAFHFGHDDLLALFADEAAAVAVGAPVNVLVGFRVILAGAVVAGTLGRSLARQRQDGQPLQIGHASNQIGVAERGFRRAGKDWDNKSKQNDNPSIAADQHSRFSKLQGGCKGMDSAGTTSIKHCLAAVCKRLLRKTNCTIVCCTSGDEISWRGVALNPQAAIRGSPWRTEISYCQDGGPSPFGWPRPFRPRARVSQRKCHKPRAKVPSFSSWGYRDRAARRSSSVQTELDDPEIEMARQADPQGIFSGRLYRPRDESDLAADRDAGPQQLGVVAPLISWRRLRCAGKRPLRDSRGRSEGCE